MTISASNIRASVRFTNSTVFAGEDVECIITFRNTALEAGSAPSPSQGQQQQNGTQARKVTPTSAKPPITRNSSYGPNVPPHLRPTTAPSKPKHGRSLSIISMGSESTVGGGEQGRGMPEGARKPGLGHSRASSLQIPRRGSTSPYVGSTTAPAPGSNGLLSPRVDGLSTPLVMDVNEVGMAQDRNGRPTAARKTSPTTAALAARKSSGMIQQNFQFPPLESLPDSPFGPDSAVSPKTGSHPFRSPSPRLAEPEASPNPISRILSESSVNGTSRSSMDLMSNHSDETIFSEYTPQPTARLVQRPGHTRTASRLGAREAPRGPETLMMGYAQIVGSFTLDGSLVNQAPFEEVKRKGVVGGHGGGGVVGVERTKRESGLFGALGWTSIGESLGGLMGGGELSSIKEMRGIANSKSIPLVSTPQSILFVDLRLAPGETKSYTYRFTLPRGLPPSHKGRALKVSYHLTVGTQRAGSGKDLQVRSVDVPFRVFGSVSPRGESLGHDLMSPYILLRDTAKTSLLSSPSELPKKPPDSGTDDFTHYIDALLDESQRQQSGLLSPTSPLSPAAGMRRHSSVAEEPRNMKDAIDLAILRSNHLANSQQNRSNKFDITRNKQRVATILLPRPAYRLGETINLIISFKDSDIPTYAMQVALETHEVIDPAIAMRSSASVYRYTRKVQAYAAETSLFAKRLSFALSIPASATPDFETSGLGLEWRIRIEFVTPRVTVDQDEETEGDGEEEGRGEAFDDLLEEVGRDDRGVMLQGVERLAVGTFEVPLPIKVYGDSVGGKGEWDVDGLVV